MILQDSTVLSIKGFGECLKKIIVTYKHMGVVLFLIGIIGLAIYWPPIILIYILIVGYAMMIVE